MATMVPRPRSPRHDDYGDHAVYLDWETEFLPWMTGKKTRHSLFGQTVPLPRAWKPGHHWAFIGTTGQGKSTQAVGVLNTRKWVLALDPKGGDETLEQSGYVRLKSVPPPHSRRLFNRGEDTGTDEWVWDRIEKGLPVGLIAGFEALTDEQDIALQQMMRDAINWCRRTRGWTLYVDEFELLSSQRMFRLGPYIERMLITARRAGTSVITSFQAPAWVSKHATRQASMVTTWDTGDRDSVRVIAQSVGRDWRMVKAAVDELPPFHSLTIPREKKRPMIVTTAPKL